MSYQGPWHAHPVVVHRSVAGRVVAWAVYALTLYLWGAAAWAWQQGRIEVEAGDVLVAAGVGLLVCALAYEAQHAPALTIDDAGLTVRNPWREHWVSWTQVTGLELRFGLRINVRTGAPVTAAAISPRNQRALRQAQGRHDDLLAAGLLEGPTLALRSRWAHPGWAATALGVALCAVGLLLGSV